MARARALAGTFAISQMRRAEEQVLVKLWHFADRFGRVTPDGVPAAPPAHPRAARRLLGMHRPAVTTALGALKDKGLGAAAGASAGCCAATRRARARLSARGGLCGRRRREPGAARGPGTAAGELTRRAPAGAGGPQMVLLEALTA